LKERYRNSKRAALSRAGICEGCQRAFNLSTSSGFGRRSSEAGQNRQLEAAQGVLTIRPSAHPRAGWAEAASSLEPEGLLDEMTATRFDDEEWSW